MDILGRAATNYFLHKDSQPVKLYIDGTFDGDMPPSVFFRTRSKLKTIEKKALEFCHGTILDVGACAGNYSLELTKQGNQVTSLDISSLLCDLMRKRGLSNVVQSDIMQFTEGSFDTILLTMNGFGIAGEFKKIPGFLNHLKRLLKPGGQIIGDTTDIAYFESQKERSGRMITPKEYHGNVMFRLEYKGLTESFPWVYPDPAILSKIAGEVGLTTQIGYSGRDFSYLMVLTKT